MDASKEIDRDRYTNHIALGEIIVGANPLRPLDGEEVKRLAVSMQRIGLMTPVAVRRVPWQNEESGDSYELIAGRHRLAAAISLGWEEIDAVEIRCSDVDARLWEIAENLHRAELTKLRRDEQVAEWIRLTDVAQVAPHQKAGQQPGGVRAAARELGVDRDDARRAVKVASLSDEAKAAAVEHHLDDNRSALLEAAKEKDPAAQVARIVKRAGKPKAKPTKRHKVAGPFDYINDNRATFERQCYLSIMAAETATVLIHDCGEIDEELFTLADNAAKAWRELAEKLSPTDAKPALGSAVKSAADRAEARSRAVAS
jgi:ParB/RepB/Spo0J family partition protein